MALIESTIGSAGDYLSLFDMELDIPSLSADDHHTEYIEALSDTTPVNVNVTGFVGTVVVDVQEAYRAEGAVSGSHAELNYGVNDTTNALLISSPGFTCNNLRIIRSGSANTAADTIDVNAGTGGATFNRCTLIGDDIGGRVFRSIVAGTQVLDCFVVDRNPDLTGAALDTMIFQNGEQAVYRTSILLLGGTRAGIVRSHGATTVLDVRETLALKTAGATATNGAFYLTSTGTWHAGCEANGSYTTDTPENTVANESLDPAAKYTSLTAGSENLHYPSRAAMLALTAGSDLSATTGTTDIDGETIAAWYPGADFVPAPAAPDGGTSYHQGLDLGLDLGV